MYVWGDEFGFESYRKSRLSYESGTGYTYQSNSERFKFLVPNDFSNFIKLNKVMPYENKGSIYLNEV